MPNTDRLRHVFTEGFWLVLGQIIVAIGALAGVRLLTELMNPSSYGELALGMTVATLVNQTLLGPLSNGVTRFYAPSLEQGDLRGYLNAVRELVVLTVKAIIVLGLVVVAVLLGSGFIERVPMALAILVFASASGCNVILCGMQNAARQRKRVALFQGVDTWARFLCAATLVMILGSTSTVAAIGYGLASICVLCIQYVSFKKSHMENASSSGDAKRWLADIWAFSWPFASWGIFTWARVASDRWALQLFTTKDEVGFYAVVFQLGYYPMSLVTSMVTQLAAPIFYQRAGNGGDGVRNAKVSSMSWQLTGAALACTFGAFLFSLLLHRQIFAVLASRQYMQISYLLPWVVLSGGLFASAQMVGLGVMSSMKTRLLIRCTIATALFGIAFNIVGAYLLGLLGVVIAGVVFSIVYLVWMSVLFLQSTRVATEVKSAYGPLRPNEKER
jgi:O-antigen/teichoic acid export membrane protein